MKKIVILVVALILLAFAALAFLFYGGREISYEPNMSETNLVQPVGFGHVNIFFVRTTSGYILVDTGMPGMEQQLDEVFKLVGVEPQRVNLIVATHGHLDHIGLMNYAKRVTGAKILAHKIVAEGLAKGEIEPAVPRNFLGHLLNIITPTDFDAVTTDIAIDKEFDLAPYGVRGKIIHAPGHSPGSLAIVLENGELLIGDQVRDIGGGKIGLGMFHDNSEQLIKTLETVTAYEPRIIYLSHGKTIDNNTLKEVVQSLKQKIRT